MTDWNWLGTKCQFWPKVFLLDSLDPVGPELKLISLLFFQVADFDFSPLSDRNLSPHSESGCGQICCRSCFLQSSQEAARESHELLLSFYKPVKTYTVWGTQLHLGYTNRHLLTHRVRSPMLHEWFGFAHAMRLNTFSPAPGRFIHWTRREQALKHSRSSFLFLNYTGVYI